jgi:hypothetical protein
MPINSNGSKLQVTTNVGGRMLENEDYFYDTYRDNKPKAKKTKGQMQAPLPPEVLEEKPKPEDAKLQAAIDTDLKKRNLK